MPNRNRRNNRPAYLICALLLAVAVFSSGCDAYRAAAKASDDLGSTVTSAIDTTSTLYSQQQVDQEEKNGIAGILQQVTQGNQEFRKNVRTIHARGGATKADYLAAANGFVDSTRTLLQSGALHVKNPQAQAKVDLFAQAIQTGLTGIITAIQGGKS